MDINSQTPKWYKFNNQKSFQKNTTNRESLKLVLFQSNFGLKTSYLIIIWSLEAWQSQFFHLKNVDYKHLRFNQK